MIDASAERAYEREAMVRWQLEARDVRDPRVLAAMRAVPRHRFVPAAGLALAYEDHPLPIGPGATISQPYIVAYMAQALALRGGERVLEVGSGCGYFAAVLALLCAEVYGVELDAVLTERAARLVEELAILNVHFRHGDGAEGWAEAAPFDAVVLSCAAPELPPELWEQLRTGGHALFPRNSRLGGQELVLLRKTEIGFEARALLPVAFVPLRHPGGPGRAS